MAIKVKRDGRVILTTRDYTKHKYEVWLKQGKCCATCGFYAPFNQVEFDHEKGRGMGGSKRDDLDPENRVRHKWCHAVRHYQKTDLAAVRA